MWLFLHRKKFKKKKSEIQASLTNIWFNYKHQSADKNLAFPLANKYGNNRKDENAVLFEGVPSFKHKKGI